MGFIHLTRAPGQHHLDLMAAGLLNDPGNAFLIVLRLTPGDIGQSGYFRAILSVRGENPYRIRQCRARAGNHIALAGLPFKKPDHEHPLLQREETHVKRGSLADGASRCPQ